MSRGLPSGVSTDFQSTTPKPVLLFDVATGGSPANVRFTNRGAAVTFGSQVFSPRRCEIEEIRIQGTSQAASLRLRVDDTDGTFHALVQAGASFQNQRVRLYRTNVGSTGGAGTDALLDVYTVDFYERAARAFSFTLKPLLAVFDIEIPLRTMTRVDFPGMPNEAG